MGALCGKKAVKKTIDSLIPPQIMPPKPSVFNPNLDNPSANKENKGSSQKNKHASNQSPLEKSEKPVQNANKSPKKDNNAEFELNMSPSKSPQKTDKSKPNIIQESQGLTPQIIEDPKPNDSIPRQNEDFIFFEPERRLVLENNEFLGKAIFGEEDFLFPEIKEPSVRELSAKNIVKIGLIGWKKLLLEPKEISDKCFEIDLFDLLQTFEPEEDESRERSDIHELNSSGIQYKEEEYGVAIGNPKISNENDIIQRKEPVFEINNEDKYDESKDRNTLPEEKPLERPENFPVENVRFPPNERTTQVYKEDPNDFKWSSNENNNYNPYNPYRNNEDFNENRSEINNKKEEFNNKEEEFNSNKQEQEKLEEESRSEKREFHINDVMNFLEEDNFETPFEDDENAEQQAYIESKIDMEKIDENFFLNKVDMDNFEEESKEELPKRNKNEEYLNYVKEQEQEALEQNYKQNDFSYDEITPEKPMDRMSSKPNTESLRKKLVWWSSKK